MAVSIYLDSASLIDIDNYAGDPTISGITTNPSILRKAGVKNYRAFAEYVLARIGDKPVSFEVLSDDWDEMYQQAIEITKWGDNVWAKVPITNTKGELSIDLIDSLSDYRINITAVMTESQLSALRTVDRAHHIISVFAGRIKDAGFLPPYIAPNEFKAQLLWASTRETYDLTSAELYNYQIITMTPELLAKLPLRGKNLTEYSLETVQQFHRDGKGIEF